MILDKVKSILKAGVNPRTALAAIASLDPRLRGFIAAAGAAGYGADKVMGFLEDQTVSQGERARRRNIQERAGSGRATPQELAEAQRIKELGQPRRAIRTAAGAAAGTAAALMADEDQPPEEEVEGEEIVVEGEQMPAPEQPQIEQQQQRAPTGGEYLQRALHGVQYFDLDEDSRSKIAPYANALMSQEESGIPWESKDVQRLVRAIRKRVGLVDQEIARSNPQSKQQPQGSSADQMILEAMNNIGGSLNAAFDQFMGGR